MSSSEQTPSASQSGRRPRADAARNRSALVAAAKAALADIHAPFSLDAVARRAGVGIGTLYRHFRTREQLVAAVYEAEVDRITLGAQEYLREMSPGEALRAWLDSFVTFASTKRGMRDAFQAGGSDGSRGNFTALQMRIADGIRPVLQAGAEDGSLRQDVEAIDVVLLAAGALVPHNIDAAQSERLIRLILDALRPARPEGASGR